MKSFLVAPAAL